MQKLIVGVGFICLHATLYQNSCQMNNCLKQWIFASCIWIYTCKCVVSCFNSKLILN